MFRKSSSDFFSFFPYLVQKGSKQVKSVVKNFFQESQSQDLTLPQIRHLKPF
jgi:hypothetical protein